MPVEWHEFYSLLGTAAAALVALLFVAASIGAGYISAERASATRTFMSPVLFHYAAVLFISLIVLIPTQTLTTLGLSITFVAGPGLIYAAFILVRVVRNPAADVADWLGYGGSPLVAYAATLIAAGLLVAHSQRGANVLAGALLLLLVVNIRNAWDTMLALVRRQSEQPPKS